MAVADIIREEGKLEGLQEGIYKGKLEGLQEGIFKGKLEEIAFVLELKYGKEGLDFYNEIRDKLKSLEDIENIKALIKKHDGLEELKKEFTV